MTVKNYNEFKTLKTSEKITLIHAHAKQYLFTFSSYSGSVYVRDIAYFVTSLTQEGTELTSVSSPASVVSGTYHFDIQEKKLYVYSTDIGNDEFIATYRFFYANAPIQASWDLSDDGDLVYYEPRLTSQIPYYVKVDGSEPSIALVGKGKVTLDNSDGHFNTFVSKLFWENRSLKVYSFHRDLAESEAKLIYDGVIEYKTLNSKSVGFKIKNKISDLDKLVELDLYDQSTDGCREDIDSTLKSRVFGRVNGLKLQSCEVVGSGYTLTGTISGNASSAILDGSGTRFLEELSPKDEITVTVGADEVDLVVETVDSDIQATLTNDLASSFSGKTGTVLPELPVPFKNRKWCVSSKVLKQTTATISQVLTSDSIQVDDVDDLESGDVLLIDTAGVDQYLTIDSVSPTTNQISFTTSFDPTPVPTDTVSRLPIQNVYYLGRELSRLDYTVTNNPSEGSYITLDADAEVNIRNTFSIDSGGSWSVSGRTFTRSTANEALETVIKPHDFVSVGDSDLMEVLQVRTTGSNTYIDCRETISGYTTGTDLKHKSVDLIGDVSTLSANVLGETLENTTSGTWCKTATDVVKKLLTEAGLGDDLDTTVFAATKATQDFTISLVLPMEAEDSSRPSTKDIINLLNISTNTFLYVDNVQKIRHDVIDTSIDFDNLEIITEADIISWDFKVEENKLYKTITYGYAPEQVNSLSEESKVNLTSVTSDLVNNVIGVDSTFELETILFDSTQAARAARRKSMLNEVANTIITFTTDLRYSSLNIGDAVLLDIELPNNYGDISSNQRVMAVIEIRVDGEKSKITLSDFGGLFYRSCKIAEDTAPDYDSATDDDKLKYGYITDTNTGIVTGEESSKKRNLII